MANTEEQRPHRSAWFKDSAVLTISVLTLISTTFQFYLREILTPQREPTALEISARLEPVGDLNGVSLVRVTVRATNPTDRRIYVPALWFSVFGYVLPVRPCDAETEWKERLGTAPDDVQVTFNEPTAIDVLAQRRMDSSGSLMFEPKDTTNYEDIVALPSGKYGFVKLHVRYMAGRSLASLDSANPIAWESDDTGRWHARPQFKALQERKTDRAAFGKATTDNELVEGQLFDMASTAWRDDEAGGEGVSEATLALWSGQSSRPLVTPEPGGGSKPGVQLRPCSSVP